MVLPLQVGTSRLPLQSLYIYIYINICMIFVKKVLLEKLTSKYYDVITIINKRLKFIS